MSVDKWFKGALKGMKQGTTDDGRPAASDDLSGRMRGTDYHTPALPTTKPRQSTPAEDQPYIEEQRVRVNKSRRNRGLPPLKGA